VNFAGRGGEEEASGASYGDFTVSSFFSTLCESVIRFD
jgi:hypothetical protein